MTTVTQLQIEIALDDKLKEMASITTCRDISNNKNFDKVSKRDRKRYYRLQSLLIFVYFVFVPFN